MIPEDLRMAIGFVLGCGLGTIGGLILMAAIVAGARSDKDRPMPPPKERQEWDWSRP